MIPKHIPRKPENDNYRALALYAADAKINGETGEKTLMSWHEGCLAEDYLSGMMEVEATQAMNTRSKKEKTYHLMVSFRPEDEAKLSPEIFKDIEKELAGALGFSEHQRHCGVHKNTDNMHMHIAYNMINPHTFNRHAPFYDHQKLHRTCRALEAKYGFKVDKGIEPNAPKKESKTNIKAQAYEAHHGQESFHSFVISRKEKILTAAENAKNWKELHESLLKIGLEIKPKGNGLVIKDHFGKHAVKASDIDRRLGKTRLEKSFGFFIGVDKETHSNIQVAEKYNALPLHQDAQRGNLYAQFLAEMEYRKATLETLKKEEQDVFNSNRKKWAEKRKTIFAHAMLPVHKKQVLEIIKTREDLELINSRLELAKKMKEVREALPYTTWTKFLQHKASQGDETALVILRSKKIKPEKMEFHSKNKLLADLGAMRQSKELQSKIIQSQGLNQKHKRALLSVIKMREMIAKNTHLKHDEVMYKIDTKGTVIFSFKNGATIRDTGQEIHFCSQSSEISIIAQKYAEKRIGAKIVHVEGVDISSKKPKAGVLDR